jgi:hypothetical protein
MPADVGVKVIYEYAIGCRQWYACHDFCHGLIVAVQKQLLKTDLELQT